MSKQLLFWWKTYFLFVGVLLGSLVLYFTLTLPHIYVHHLIGCGALFVGALLVAYTGIRAVNKERDRYYNNDHAP